MSPAARALLTLELIQATPGITADRLAASLAVTSRAARRYVDILREAGIPIDATRGPYGGYRLGRGVRLAPLTFTPAEALALVMAVLDGHHDVADPTTPVGAAIGKLTRVLPQVETVRRTAAPAPDRGAARPDPEITMTLVTACAAAQQVRLSYCSESGKSWTAEVDPWSVVVRHGRWYLLCHSHAANARRTYRIDRVRSAELLTTTFTPPADLDPVATLEEHLAVGWEFAVEVLIAAPVSAVTGWLPAALGRVTPIDETTCRLTATTSNPHWYAEQLATFRAPYRLVNSPEVAEAARAVAVRLLAATG